MPWSVKNYVDEYIRNIYLALLNLLHLTSTTCVSVKLAGWLQQAHALVVDDMVTDLFKKMSEGKATWLNNV